MKLGFLCLGSALHRKEPVEVDQASDQDHPGYVPLEVFQAGPKGRRPQGSLRTHWKDLYISSGPD